MNLLQPGVPRIIAPWGRLRKPPTFALVPKTFLCFPWAFCLPKTRADEGKWGKAEPKTVPYDTGFHLALQAVTKTHRLSSGLSEEGNGYL